MVAARLLNFKMIRLAADYAALMVSSLHGVVSKFSGSLSACHDEGQRYTSSGA
jgi:hypothetical protein